LEWPRPLEYQIAVPGALKRPKGDGMGWNEKVKEKIKDPDMTLCAWDIIAEK